MEPSKKSPQMTEFLEKLTGRTSSLEANFCVKPPFGCGKKALNFDDDLSRKEYRISGLCQECQNSVFS